MPGPGGSPLETLYSLISEPVFDDLFQSILREWRQPSRPDDLWDESVGSFFSRRLGSSSVADNLVSAVFHGIYAGDIYQLSARSLLSQAWQYEGRYGTLFKAFWRRRGVVPILQEDLALLQQKDTVSMAGQSVFSFMGGLQDLSDTIYNALESNSNVEIRKETDVKELKLEKSELDLKVCFRGLNQLLRRSHTLPFKIDHFC